MPNVQVEVTEADIQRGYQYCATGCPVARAIRRVTGMPAIVDVRNARVGGLEVDLPTEATIFITAFDKHGPEAVVPFSFDLVLL